MESVTLTKFLKSICCNSPWNYAVFWKLQQQNQMLLTLEDGYCHSARQTNSVESIVDDMCFKSSDEILSSKSGQIICDGNIGTDPVQLAVACMSNSQYKLGDGIVGEVASSGIYLWVFSDDLTDGEYGSKCPDDWLFQVAVGINTLLLVPLVPHGVLQLGSLETVAQDLTVVVNVKDRFLMYLQFIGCSATIPTIIRPALVENELFGVTMNGIKSEDSNDDNSIEHLFPVLPTMDEIKPSSNDNKLEMTRSSLFGFSCIEELHAFSHPISDNLGAFGEYNFETMNSNCDMGTTPQFLLDTEASNFGTLFDFPTDCELHKALGPTIMGQTNKYLLKTPISGELEYNSSSMLFDDDFINNSGSTVWETKGSLNKYGFEHPFGSVAATVNCRLEKNISDKPIHIKSSMTSVEQLSAFSKEQSQSERLRMQVVQDGAQESCVTSATNALCNLARNANTSYSPSTTSFESVMSALVGEENQKKGHRNMHLRNGAKLSSAKRSAKTGDHKKPRPRDRQLIQDRLKELRDMVPNGVKCSIDGLLDRTVQHMIFLRRVTDQADRLRKLTHQEVNGGKNLKSSDRKRGQRNGTSWAVELGNEQQLFPIIVEDLEFPGHMLIEMLCGDHGCFLDIAEVIRRLDLTILKGVLEKRLESTWATFIVEVPRGFHRLDIFWPLMQLLQ